MAGDAEQFGDDTNRGADRLDGEIDHQLPDCEECGTHCDRVKTAWVIRRECPNCGWSTVVFAR
jgi:hypothetical protein